MNLYVFLRHETSSFGAFAARVRNGRFEGVSGLSLKLLFGSIKLFKPFLLFSASLGEIGGIGGFPREIFFRLQLLIAVAWEDARIAWACHVDRAKLWDSHH